MIKSATGLKAKVRNMAKEDGKEAFVIEYENNIYEEMSLLILMVLNLIFMNE